MGLFFSHTRLEYFPWEKQSIYLGFKSINQLLLCFPNRILRFVATVLLPVAPNNPKSVPVTHLVIKQLHDEGGHAAIDADEEVDAGQHHVRCAGNAEDEGSWIHHGGDGPPGERQQCTKSAFPLVSLSEEFYSVIMPCEVFLTNKQISADKGMDSQGCWLSKGV